MRKQMEHTDIGDISRTAHRLIALHGDQAPTVAASRAADMEKAGDVRRRTSWLCVMIRTQNLILSGQGF